MIVLRSYEAPLEVALSDCIRSELTVAVGAYKEVARDSLIRWPGA